MMNCLVLIFVAVLTTGCYADLLRFAPKTEYRYSYEGHTDMPRVGTIKVSARISIIPLTLFDKTQQCRLLIRDYNLMVNDGEIDYVPDLPRSHFNFKQWLSFDISGEGTVSHVHYPPEEEAAVLALKKILLGTFSSKLLASRDNLKSLNRWAYRVNETGHEGDHESTYQAEPSSDGIQFTKTRHTKAVDNANQKHVKVVDYHGRMHVPRNIHVKEHFESPTKTSPNYTPSRSEMKEPTDANYILPMMAGYSEGRLSLERTTALDDDHYLSLVSQPQNLTSDSIKVGQVPLPNLPLEKVVADFKGNLTCIKIAHERDMSKGMPCFRSLWTLAGRLNEEDLENLTLSYLKDPRQTLLTQQTIVDLLGVMATNQTWRLLTEHILDNTNPHPELIVRTLSHFLEEEKMPPKMFLDTLEEVVFEKPFNFEDERLNQQVNDAAMLALGALVDYMKVYNRTWSSRMVSKLEQQLGIHDPWYHRQVRSTFSQIDLNKHMERKSTHLLSLGNALMDSSLECIKSYLNSSETHILLRTSAIDAISQYPHEEVAQLLLDTALNPSEDNNIRQAALGSYSNHPFGGDIQTVLQMMHGMSNGTSISSVEHERVRRGISDTVARVFQGFQFKLETPSVNFKKTIGGSNLGASFGLIIRNLLDIDIAPLKGHVIADVFDSAYATLHLGILGMELDFFKAELCFKGSIRYDLNILKEYGFGDVAKFADIYNTHIKSVINKVKTAVTSFKSLVKSYENYSPAEIIDDLIRTIKELPKNVANLKRIGKRVWEAVSKFVDLPPVVEKVVNLVKRVTTLFKDIKSDITKLYDSVVEIITVHIPWAWDEIKSSFKGIVEAIKNIIKNPKTSIQNIGKGVAKVAAAVGVLINAKDKVVENNFFSKDNRPYWFDLGDILKEIWEDVKDVGAAIKDSIDGLSDDQSVNEMAKKFTGVELTTMKNQAMKEIVTIALEEFEEPLNKLNKLIEPFVQTVDFFKNTVKNIKEGWTSLVTGYREARSLLEMIFGPKAHKKFPRKYLESKSCGNGFWESDGNGKYKHKGVDAEISNGDELVAPFNGRLTVTGASQVTIAIENIKDVEVILDNVNPDSSLDGGLVGAGDPIGTVLPPKGCQDSHIHFSMRKINTTEYIDPSRYMERREMPKPQWIQECDRYILIWKFKTIRAGKILGGPEESDETPGLPDAPPEAELIIDDKIDPSDFDDVRNGRRRKRSLTSIFEGIKNFTDSLGIPDKIAKLKDLFKFRMSDVTVGKVFDLLDKAGLTELKERIIKALKFVEDQTNRETCVRPDSLEDNELKQALVLRGKSDSGARQTLINRYLESEPRCFGMKNKLRDTIYCRFDETCTGMYCCIDLKFLIYRHAISAYIQYNPCNYELTIGLNEWTKTISILDPEFALEGEDEVNLTILKVAKLTLHHKIKKTGDTLTITVELSWCSNRAEECWTPITFIDGAEIPIIACQQQNKTTVQITRPSNVPTVDAMMNVSISDVTKFVENSGLSTDDINDLVDALREAFQTWLLDQIKKMVIEIFGEEFDLFDLCAKGYEITIGPYKKIFFQGTVYFQLGPIPMYFNWGVGGYYGVNFKATMCVMSMKATAVMVPQIGSEVWGALGINLWLFKAELRLTGYILTTVIPTKVEVGFSQFPLDIKSRMDLELIPLRIELRALLIFELKFKIWGKSFGIRKVLINVKLWDYQSKSINKNIFNLNDAEKDDTPPDFTMFSKAEDIDSDKDEGGRRRRRAISRTTQRCTVSQVKGLDYTEPAFQLELGVDDDRSEVTMTYCVGISPGGCDVINNQPLGGSSALISQVMISGHKLYFTVTATNSMGGSAKATCYLETYDMTPPGGRVNSQYRTTSNPEVLHGSVFVVDDSPVISKMVAVGLGKGLYGSQVVDWHTLSNSDKVESNVNTGHDPLGLRSLEHFAAPRQGSLVYQPYKVTSYAAPIACAKECLSYPSLRCQSFNYDYSQAGTCEFLEAVEGPTIKIHKRGQFHYFERKGIGHVSSLVYDGLKLVHNQMYFINGHFINSLGYSSMLHGTGTLFDETPPNPGLIKNALEEEWLQKPCKEFTPSHFHSRCVGETPLDNFRFIVDGPGSRTVFNGPKPLIDLQYTRANKMVSANWDAIHENETRILVYTWSVGASPCEDNIHAHRDPHAHLASSSEWTHMGIIHPVNMADGAYHVTVNALNDVDYGGPMAVSVCHSTPYIIDNTPPIIYSIFNVTYNETDFMITVQLNATDDVSGIKRVELGLGSSPRNTYTLDYVDVTNFTYPSYNYKVPDGVPTWIKIRVTNYVDLRAAGHSDKPIVVDTSPPIAGDLFDGPHRRVDKTYQKSTTKYCANWVDFHDPESGISRYIFGLGTSNGTDDVVNWIELHHTITSWCLENLSLQHKTVYYSTLTAINGGLKERNITVSSDGVYVDATPPVVGWVKDGSDPDKDMQYSSDPATVSAVLGNFTDPESGLQKFDANIYRQHAIEGSIETLVHKESPIAPDTSSVLLHHFHLHHGDKVRTEINATNRAEGSSSGTSSGYTVDLTDPIMVKLVDGDDVNNDQMFTASTTQLSASWLFNDPESGVDRYLVSVFQLYNGIRSQIYPISGEELLSGTATRWQSGAELQELRNGGLYSIRVTAINGAGLAAVHDTTGVIVDPTPPRLLYVHGGVLGGQSEEVIEGFILHNDPSGIPASWKGQDPESKINDYMVAIGTTAGGSDIMGFTSMGTKEDSYISGLTLQLFEDSSQVYYISVKAVNGAGMASDVMSSSAIKVVDGDKTGVVSDGPEASVDVDYQLDTSTLTLTFDGFESELHGISHIAFCVGSRPGVDDVVPYSSAGLLVEDDQQHASIGGKGKAQALVPLSEGTKYYATVKAVTGAGNVLEAASDGFTVDITSPSLSMLSIESVELAEHDGSPLYVKTIDSLSASWNILETESILEKSWITLGTFPGASDLNNTIETTSFTALPNGLLRPDNVKGVPIILNLYARNNVGLETADSFPEVIIDTTPPGDGYVKCPKFTQGAEALRCSWSGFVELESGVDYYLFGMGRGEGDDSVLPYQVVDGELNIHQVSDFKDGGLEHQGVYYVTVIAVNRVGLRRAAYSQPIRVDNTQPVGGLVIELSDITLVNVSYPDQPGVKCDQGQVCEARDAKCQRSLTQVSVAWEPFTDDETEIIGYAVALGSTPGGSQISAFAPVPAGQTSEVVRGVDLATVRQVFATVKGYNAAGLYTAVTSDGVYISRISAGLSPLGLSKVYDGVAKGKDLEFQEHNTGLGANWDFSGDPCPVKQYEWSIVRFDGQVTIPMEVVPDGQTQAEVDDLVLRDGESYYVVVRATNQLGYSYSLHSDGMTVKLEPLVPGTVRDGDIIGTDLNFWPYTYTLSANWDGFGTDRQIDNDILENGDPNVDVEIGHHQTVEYYEVALGTDRRYPNTRDNIHPFIEVGINKTWTFNHLDLIARSATYYVTVRAYSLSTAMVEVTSNGVKVGYGAKVISHGELDIPRFVSSTSQLKLSWSQFEFAVPVQSYIWALGSQNEQIEKILCKDLQNVDTDGNFPAELTVLFDVTKPHNIGTDTAVNLDKLALVQGASYNVLVMASDESGGCALVVGSFMVDTTPPVEGILTIGEGTTMAILYTPSEDSIEVSWSGYSDPESSITGYEISLLTAPSCTTPISEHTTVIDFAQLSHSARNYTYFNQKLQHDTPYFVHLRAVNGAKLVTTSVSKAILVDSISPSPGSVKDGDNFRLDLLYQSSTTQMEGTILYLPNPHGEHCPMRMPLESPVPNKITSVTSKGICSVFGCDLLYDTPIKTSQVAVSNKELQITLVRDVQEERMLSGAASTTADILNGGTYQFEIKAADADFHSVTSVAFIDGAKDGQVYDFVENIFNETSYVSQKEEEDTFGRVVDKNEPVINIEVGADSNEKPVGFGFQIHTGVENMTSNVLTLWCMRGNETWHESVTLDFDPATDFHTYRLVINEDGLDEGNQWQLSMYIDNKGVVIVYGVNNVSSSAQIQMSVYNRQGWVAPLPDAFNPSSVTAAFKQLSFPPPSTALCRYGDVFRAGDQAIVEFWAGVGTTPSTDDVSPYQKIHSPCVPCQRPCDADVCSSICDVNKVQEIPVLLTNLSLTSQAMEEEGAGNLTLLQLYYLTVKSTTGSGRWVQSGSNGVYIDVSPPNITELFHLDMDWDSQEPSEFQGNNHTIAVYWEAVDDQSQVVDYQWAIGSSPSTTDIQPFISVGLSTFAYNSSLEGKLQDRHTYYVSIRAFNGAGLSFTRVSTGVTVLLDEPDLSNTPTKMEDSEPFPNNTKGNAVKSTKQNSVGVEWGEPDADQNIDAIYVEMGTSSDKSDVFPQRQVGLNSSGKIEVTSEGIKLQDQPDGNMSDVRERHKRSTGQLLLEPGRSVKTKIKACNKAHKCGLLPTKDVIIVRGEDIVASAQHGILNSRIDDVHVQARKTQEDGKTLVMGILSETDMVQDYHSEASMDFKPVIVNPADTQNLNNRFMKDRNRGWEGRYFYLSTLPDQPVPGGVEVTVAFSKARFPLGFNGQTSPRLLAWCADDEYWTDASRSCSDSTDSLQVDWSAGVIRVKICDLQLACSEGKAGPVQAGRRRRATMDNSFSGPVALGLANTNNTLANTPPIVTSKDTFHMDEDSGKAVIMLTARDPESDAFIFKLNSSFPYQGKVELASNGLLQFTPVENFAGEVLIHFKVIEKQILEGVDALITKGTLKVLVRPANDYPVLLFLSEGRDIIPTSQTLNLTVEQSQAGNHSRQHELEIILAAYDIDMNDSVIIRLDPSVSGHMQKSVLAGDVNIQAQDCSLSWSQRKPLWDTLSSKLQNGASTVKLPMPCGLDTKSSFTNIEWDMVHITYTPHHGFYGKDKIKVLAVDKLGSRSELLTINIYVLENLCENNSTCSGPVNDPGCTSLARASGFDIMGYKCAGCPLGYSGSHCDYEILECLSNPCHYNFTCIDLLADYECICENNTWPCGAAEAISGPSLLLWQYGLLYSIAPVLIISVFVIILIMYCVRKAKAEKNKVYPDDDVPSTTSDYPTRALFKRDIPGRRDKQQWYDNPLFDGENRYRLPHVGYNPRHMPLSSGYDISEEQLMKFDRSLQEHGHHSNVYTTEPVKPFLADPVYNDRRQLLVSSEESDGEWPMNHMVAMTGQHRTRSPGRPRSGEAQEHRSRGRSVSPTRRTRQGSTRGRSVSPTRRGPLSPARGRRPSPRRAPPMSLDQDKQASPPYASQGRDNLSFFPADHVRHPFAPRVQRPLGAEATADRYQETYMDRAGRLPPLSHSVYRGVESPSGSSESWYSMHDKQRRMEQRNGQPWPLIKAWKDTFRRYSKGYFSKPHYKDEY